MRGASPSGCTAMRSAFGRSQQMRRDAVEQHRGTGVGVHDLPAAVDHHTRKWVVGVENPLDPLPHRGHIGVVEGAFAVDRREAGGHQQLILFAQRHVEHPGESQHHRAARCRTARLDEADVAGRHVGLDREVELRQPAALPPLAHQRAERRTLDLGGGGHAPSVAHGGDRSHYL